MYFWERGKWIRWRANCVSEKVGNTLNMTGDSIYIIFIADNIQVFKIQINTLGTRVFSWEMKLNKFYVETIHIIK